MVNAAQPQGHESLATPLALPVTRASLAFILDNVQLSRGGSDDLLSPLIFTAILDANMAPVNRDPELQVTYGGVESSAPDELRRPVSVNAVSQSLRLPFETVRRRVQDLARAGACVVTPQGVYVPRAAVTSPGYIAIQAARHERLGAFYAELLALGALAPPPHPPAANPGEPLVRLTNRALSEYMLRACNDLVSLTGHVLDSLILLAVACHNLRGLGPDALAAWPADPLAHGRPVRVAALAHALRLPPETTRRRLVVLEELRFCRRSRLGAVATAPPRAWPALSEMAEANLVNVQRLFARLAALGALGGWQS